MAQLTYGVIRGERDFDAYCMRRWKQRAQFRGTFARIENVYIERFWEMSPAEEDYQEYFLMTMPTNRDTGLYEHSDIARMVHQQIRNGTIKLIK